MSETKFTKGPWQIDDDEGALRLFVYSEEHGNVCTVSLFDQRDREAVLLGKTPEDDPNQKEYKDFDKICANASLIAAAPDMYDLLLDIVTDYQCMPNPAVMADKINAVLKKAIGEE